MYVGRQGVGNRALANDYNRAYGLDLGWQTSTSGRLTAFMARTDSPESKGGSDYAGALSFQHTNEVWTNGGGFTQVGDRFNPEVGFLQLRGYRRFEARSNMRYQRKQWPCIRSISPHISYNAYLQL